MARPPVTTPSVQGNLLTRSETSTRSRTVGFQFSCRFKRGQGTSTPTAQQLAAALPPPKARYSPTLSVFPQGRQSLLMQCPESSSQFLNPRLLPLQLLVAFSCSFSRTAKGGKANSGLRRHLKFSLLELLAARRCGFNQEES